MDRDGFVNHLCFFLMGIYGYAGREGLGIRERCGNLARKETWYPVDACRSEPTICYVHSLHVVCSVAVIQKEECYGREKS